jgi:cysteinyl-tRNA synthetase
MANYWMHNGFLQVEGEKMSKSLGNFFTINELLTTRKFGSNQWHGYVLRLAMLMTHYRQPVDWTVDRLVEARKLLKDWIDTAYGAEPKSATPPTEIVDPLLDDLNTPGVLTALHALNRDARPDRLNVEAARKLNSALRFLGIWNGEETNEIYGYGYEVQAGPSHFDVEPLIAARAEARARKDFKESDRIRDELAAMGVVLKDGKDADGRPVTTWEIAR